MAGACVRTLAGPGAAGPGAAGPGAGGAIAEGARAAGEPSDAAYWLSGSYADLIIRNEMVATRIVVTVTSPGMPKRRRRCCDFEDVIPDSSGLGVDPLPARSCNDAEVPADVSTVRRMASIAMSRPSSRRLRGVL